MRNNRLMKWWNRLTYDTRVIIIITIGLFILGMINANWDNLMYFLGFDLSGQ